MDARIPIAIKDNSQAQLNAGISASSTTIPLKAGEGQYLPTTYNGTTDDAGDSTTLELTGVGALGISVGDSIYNLTSSSCAVVTAVNTDSLTTSTLRGSNGAVDTWDSGDDFVVNPFVAVFNSRNENGEIIAYEKVLIHKRDTDTLYCDVANRGFDNSVARAFAADDYVSVLVEQTIIQKQINIALAELYMKKADIENVMLLTGAQSADGVKTFNELPKLDSYEAPTLDVQFAPKKYVDDNAGGAGQITKTMEGNCSAGDRLFVNADGKLQVVNDNLIETETQLKSMSGCTFIDVCKLDTDKYLFIYGDTTNLYGKVGTVDSNDSWTFGSEVNFNTSGTIQVLRVKHLDTDKAIIATSRSLSTKFFIATASGTTLTVSGEQNGTGTLAGSYIAMELTVLSPTKVVLGYRDSSSNWPAFFTATISGTVVTSYSPTTVQGYSSYFGFSVGKVDSSHVICFAHGLVSGQNYGHYVIYDVSTPSSPSQTKAPTSYGASYWNNFENVYEDWDADTEGGNYLFSTNASGIQVIWITSTTKTNIKTMRSALNYGGSVTNAILYQDRYRTGISRDKLCVLPYGRGNTQFENHEWEEIENQALSLGIGNSATAHDVSRVAPRHSGKYVVVMCGNTLAHPTVAIGKYSTINEAMYLANSAATHGNTVVAIGVGGILTGESGLTPGDRYYKDDDLWGVADSATSVYINYIRTW